MTKIALLSAEQITAYLDLIYSADHPNREYFIRLAKSMPEAMTLYELSGLLDPADPGYNIVRHQILEAARMKTSLRLLKTNPVFEHEALLGAACHDHDKLYEVRHTKANSRTWRSFEEAGEHSVTLMRDADLPDEVIRIASACGHLSLLAARTISWAAISPQDLVWALQHYIDDYTIDDKPVTPAAEENGVLTNDLIRRMRKNEEHPNYRLLNEEGISLFSRKTFTEQLLRSLRFQEEIAARMSASTGIPVTGTKLPEFIEEQLNADIGRFYEK